MRTLGTMRALSLIVACSCAASSGSGSTQSLPTEPAGASTPAPGPAPGPSPGDAGADAMTSPVTFDKHVVDAKAAGAAWITVADVDGDGRGELVVSRFGAIGFAGIPNGDVVAYKRGATLDDWTSSTIVATAAGIKFPNETTVRDLDGDGALDVIVPFGFLACAANPLGGPCGGLAWFRQEPGGLGGFTRHDIVASGSSLFYHHAELTDVDGDGVLDIVTVGEEKSSGLTGGTTRAVTQWFRGTTTPDRFEGTPRVIGDGLGSLPFVMDLDGDGDLDVASAELFVGGESFAWFERLASPSTAEPDGVWTKHVIDATSGPAIMLAPAPNLLGDGKLMLVGTNHVNTGKSPPDAWHESVLSFASAGDARAPWVKTVLDASLVSAPGSAFAPQGAPGVFATGDVDGDGDVDLVVAGDGDPRVVWYEQRADHSFALHVLEPNLAQAGGCRIVDLDGDGKNEIIVTGYVDGAVLVFSRR